MNALLLLLIAQFEVPPITVVKPGAGFLIADGVSEVPLEIVLNGTGEIKEAKVKAEAGNVVGKPAVVGGRRVRFLYRVPKSNTGVEEVVDIQLRLSNGNTVSTIYTLAIDAPGKLKVVLDTTPDIFDANSPPEEIALSAKATGGKLEALQIFTDKGEIDQEPPGGDASSLEANARLKVPELPPDAPSHLTMVAVAAAANGYGLDVGGVGARAPVRISVEIPAGTKLVVEGAENKPAAVRAPADGRTVMDNVIVRYGSRVKAFVVDERKKKKPLSVVLPTGVISGGVIAPIPGQTIADGGTGPSLVVAIPPSALGGKIFWPDLSVEGAKLVKTIDAGRNAKVLVIQRPAEGGRVTVLLDEIPAGAVDFMPSRGVAIAFVAAPAERDERAAAIAVVTGARGEPTDLPVPRVRASTGVTLTPQRVGTGRYRVALPSGSQGTPGEEIELIAELPPPPVIAGQALELVAASTKVRLEGAPPAVKPEEPTTAEVQIEEKDGGEAGTKLAIGIAAAGLVGASFGRLLVLGGGLQLELRLPFWEQRVGVRTGAEFLHHSGGTEARLGEGTVDVRTRIAGFLIPVEVLIAYVTSELFEATVRAGGDVRIERGAVTVGGDNAGGSSRVGFSARFGLDAILKLDAGHITLGVTLVGLGADASGFSAGRAELAGSLLGLRADLSYGFWF